MTPQILVQSYALVLVTDRDTLAIKAVSAHSDDQFGRSAEELLGSTLHDFVPEKVISEIQDSLSENFPAIVKLIDPEGWKPGNYQLVVRTVGAELVIEIEPRRTWPHAGDYAARLNDFTAELEAQSDLDDLLERLCEGLIYHFDFDRAIVIQFDDIQNATVTHQAQKPGQTSLLNVRYVEKDIPMVERKSQLTETVYVYTDNEKALVEIQGEVSDEVRTVLEAHSAARRPNRNILRFLTDSGYSTLSYISLVIDGKLWGSVYLHNRNSFYVDYQMRAFMRVIGRVAQQRAAYHLHYRRLRMQKTANEVRDRLYDQVAKANSLAEGLLEGDITALDLIEGTPGVALCSDQELTCFGTTPEVNDINVIIDWLQKEIGDDKIWSTDQLKEHLPAAHDLTDTAAGILYLPLDTAANQWVLWFRPETVETITYGSQADITGVEGERSYEMTSETCYNCSLPWTQDQLGTAQGLQWFVQQVVMERYASVRHSNKLLREAYEDLEIFSYAVGHDLRAPLRGISSYADILHEEYNNQLGDPGRQYLHIIRQNASRMRLFMDDLLSLNRIDRRQMVVNQLSIRNLVDRVLRDLVNFDDQQIACEVHREIPDIHGDRNYLLIVFTNLISNALKYSAEAREPRVEVGFTGEYRDGCPVFYVEDNGIGIPEDQHDRIFDLFARSSNSGDYEGTGIGLALVQRIIRFHEGRIWLESEVDRGTKFMFYTGVGCEEQAE
ncbi:sensor histidine kinase [Lewinella sp. IMCC34191]|uniref:sensor histidine kinase n=1 Tax=Lewinella sp. IMCC34191 TaxID=2259172 RepID=UPI000E27E625|nr:ATP-binding protein [Lewinella sp. IMCC34191]